ncbi:MAG: T9SS type A sorting domain-containing protein, partial [Bacteroidetes bacterium]|nr:T9SS type A sorting domain-containing protein [Bacteroidota bacterium]
SYNSLGTTPGSGFLLYPNPTSGQACIEIMNNFGPVEVSIYNMTGELVRKQNLPGTGLIRSLTQPVDVSTLGSGLYLIRVSANGETTTNKLIIY